MRLSKIVMSVAAMVAAASMVGCGGGGDDGGSQGCDEIRVARYGKEAAGGIGSCVVAYPYKAFRDLPAAGLVNLHPGDAIISPQSFCSLSYSKLDSIASPTAYSVLMGQYALYRDWEFAERWRCMSPDLLATLTPERIFYLKRDEYQNWLAFWYQADWRKVEALTDSQMQKMGCELTKGWSSALLSGIGSKTLARFEANCAK